MICSCGFAYLSSRVLGACLDLGPPITGESSLIRTGSRGDTFSSFTSSCFPPFSRFKISSCSSAVLVGLTPETPQNFLGGFMTFSGSGFKVFSFRLDSKLLIDSSSSIILSIKSMFWTCKLKLRTMFLLKLPARAPSSDTIS